MTCNVKRLAEHLKKYMLFYVVVVILLALPIGYFNIELFRTHKNLFKNIILGLAIATLYPSMIQLRLEKLGKELRFKSRETLTTLILIFIIAPLLAMVLANLIPQKEVAIGYVTANVVPASSASIAYVLLAEGNIEFATLLAALSIICAIIAVPLYVGIYARSVAVSLPMQVLGESVALALLTPLLLGQVTRYYVIKRRAILAAKNPDLRFPCKKLGLGTIDPNEKISVEKAYSSLEETVECIEDRIAKRLKPYLTISTVSTMLALIFILIANKAYMLIRNPGIVGTIIELQLMFYSVLLVLIFLASKTLRLSYRDHMGMVFIAMTKNESVAAAVSVMSIGTTAALPAALIPAIQPIVAIGYLSLAPLLRRILMEE